MSGASPKTAANWRSWDGRCDRPCAPDREVSVLLRDGRVLKGRAGQWCWLRGRAPDDDEPDDIVAWRDRGPSTVHPLRAAAP